MQYLVKILGSSMAFLRLKGFCLVMCISSVAAHFRVVNSLLMHFILEWCLCELRVGGWMRG